MNTTDVEADSQKPEVIEGLVWKDVILHQLSCELFRSRDNALQSLTLMADIPYDPTDEILIACGCDYFNIKVKGNTHHSV